MRTSVLFASIATLCLAACEPSTLRRSQGHTVALETIETVPALPTPPAPPTGIPAEDLAPAMPAASLALAHEEHLAPVDHLGRARALRAEGDLAGALTEARRAVYDAGEDLDARETALDHLIPLARQTGQTVLALEAYTELGHLFPDGPEPLVQKARILLEVGDTGASLRAAEAALLLDPEYPEVYHVLGRAHLAAGQLPEAILRFQQTLHLDPYHGYALNNLGLAWLLSGDAERNNTAAAEALAQAAYLLPYEGFVHNNLGLAYERLGRYDEALMAYDTATRLSPKNPRARVNKARLAQQVQASR